MGASNWRGKCCFVSFFVWVFMGSFSLAEGGAWVVAHRGLCGEAPENTLIAMEKAVELGVEMIELDVQQNREGVPVVIHDAYTGRTTSSGERRLIGELSLEEIKALDAGKWFGEEFSGEKIPLLAEVLHMPRGSCRLMVELKRGLAPAQVFVERVRRTFEACEVVMDPQKILVGSLDVAIVQELQQHFPSKCVVGIAEGKEELDFFQNLEIGTVAAYKEVLNPEAMRDLKQRGKRVLVWTVNDLEEAKRWIQAHVDGIITNEARAVKELVEKEI